MINGTWQGTNYMMELAITAASDGGGQGAFEGVMPGSVMTAEVRQVLLFVAGGDRGRGIPPVRSGGAVQ